MRESLSPMLTIPFHGRMIYIPQQIMGSETRTPNMVVKIGSGENHLTSSVLKDYEDYTLAYHMEYEICRQADYDQGAQNYTAALPYLSEVVFAIPSEPIQADIFNLLINGVPIDLIEFVEIQNSGVYNEPREIVSFMNCIITNARRYNASWGGDARNNLLLGAFRATQWAVRVISVDQGNNPVGTGAIDHQFETSAAA